MPSIFCDLINFNLSTNNFIVLFQWKTHKLKYIWDCHVDGDLNFNQIWCAGYFQQLTAEGKLSHLNSHGKQIHFNWLPKITGIQLIIQLLRKKQPHSFSKTGINKGLANAKRPCCCSVLCLRPKSSLCSCPHDPHYGRIVVFSLSLTVKTS